MLTVVYHSILQRKLVFLLSYRTFSDSFAVGVVKRDNVKWLQADLTAFTVSQQSLTVSAVTNYTLILHHSLLHVT
jgi:hypothetical protein